VHYIDTSALLKWYLPERDSDLVARWIELQPDLAFSRLAWLEFRCALNRRVRVGTLTSVAADSALSNFRDDAADGAFTLLPLTDADALAADALIAELPGAALRTLDALHLAVARSHRAAGLATADRVMAQAAREIKIPVIEFGLAP
jgi:hypothetical protein